jgi:hypothetical protein
MRRGVRQLLLTLSLPLLAAAALAPGGLGKTAASPFYVVPTQTSKECDGVARCVGVTGPWVAVPARGEATYLLDCPERHRYLIGGTDARASSNSVRVWFDGQLGAPIGAPSSQTSTGAALLFHAVTTNGKPGSFEPTLGCVALKPNSARSTVSARQGAVLPGTTPSAPLDLHAVTVELSPGAKYAQRVSCLKNGKIVGWWQALTFLTGPPDVSHANALTVQHLVRHGSVLIALIETKSPLFLALGAYPEVQIGVKCAT